MRATETGLAALSAEEIAFLSAPSQDADDFAARLTGALAATLSARLRLPVRLAAGVAGAGADTAAPVWQIDGALSALWLARRLGGRIARGDAPFVPCGLQLTLDAVLAERWLDRPGDVPAALAWQLIAEGGAARLALALPAASQDMTRWARETITR